MTSLDVILLNNNELRGKLPESVKSLANLTKFDASFNRFGGSIGRSLFAEMTGMQELRLGNNAFEGSLPDSLGNMTDLQIFDVEVSIYRR